MIKVICSMCKEELMEPGAILLDVPDKHSMCKKYHLCVKCYNFIKTIIDKINEI